MSNIAGKAYAMNVITPIHSYMAWINKVIFWVALKMPPTLRGLITLSLIHYARWVIIGKKQFPHLDASQPRENLPLRWRCHLIIWKFADPHHRME